MVDFRSESGSGRFATARVADLIESALDEVLPLIADVVDRGHRLNDTRGRTGEGEFTVRDLALVQRERSETKNHEAAVGELTGVVFVEIEDDFFVGELVVADLHEDFSDG